jgi:hypothetical protein
MTCRTAAASMLLFFIFFPVPVIAQPGDRHLNMEARVLDILFPLDDVPKPYFLKMILRFSDSDMQLVIVVYADKEKYWVRRCEITRYTVAGMGKGQLSQFVSHMVAQNPNVTDQEIASKLKAEVTRSSVAPQALNRALEELKTVRISPALADRTAVDAFSEYEYWYDNWQECVHYTVTGPFKEDPQDQLVRWMIRFKDNLTDLIKTGSVPRP